MINKPCEVDYQPFNLWAKIGKDKEEISNKSITLSDDDFTKEESKSVFTFSIKLERNPQQPVLYVVFPTFAISFFSLFSFLLGCGEGTYSD